MLQPESWGVQGYLQRIPLARIELQGLLIGLEGSTMIALQPGFRNLF